MQNAIRIIAGVWFAAALLSLSGCESRPARPPGAGRIATVEILRPVIVPANRAHAKFQGGRAVDGADPREPYCVLEISTVSEQPQRVAPDVFAVTRIASAILSDPVARLPVFSPFVSLTCTELVYYEVSLRLASDLQPGVRRLSCLQAFDVCRGGYYPGREAIEHALGPGFRLQ